MLKKSCYLLFICAAVFIAACSETHRDIYQYENVYVTSDIDDFKLSHIRKHVGDSVLYVNSHGNLFDKSSTESLCEKNAVNCFFVDLKLESDQVQLELKTALAELAKLKSKPTLLVSENYNSAALLLGAYAIEVKGAGRTKAEEIAKALAVGPEKLESIQKLLVIN